MFKNGVELKLTLNKAVDFALSVVKYSVVATYVDNLTFVDCQHCRLYLWIDTI